MIYQRMDRDDIANATKVIGNEINKGESSMTSLIRYIRPNSWMSLQNDARTLAEEKIISSVTSGQYDFYTSSAKTGILGTWGGRFGRYMKRKKDLGNALINSLASDWYTQNYVAKYYLRSIVFIIEDEKEIATACQNMAYALITNQAKLLRTRFLEVCSDYPDNWKDKLKAEIMERSDEGDTYATKALAALVA
ncbi:TPA: hypothetical protein ACF2X8_001870 [Yersinia enterocolitica]